ncbi:MAG: TIGR03619 family F420-dependent LLM class oxidoreductase [Myxococcota bacterium]
MELGVSVRSMGPQSRADTILACVRAAEEAGLADVWVQDHLAIPPDDAEGSGGRYLDPLTALAWLAAKTTHIGLGVGVLILPYRPPLPTAKAIATVQELSGGRLRLGVGVGWMQPEFGALGVPRRRRGALTDEALAFFRDCFADDVVTANGQEFLFLPRPPRPPIYVGGAGEHALRRTVRYGDGWFPMFAKADALAAGVRRLREMADEAGRDVPEVVSFTAFDPRQPEGVGARLDELRSCGVTKLVAGTRYQDVDGFRRQVDFLRDEVLPRVR